MKKKVFIAAPTSNRAEQMFIQELFIELYTATAFHEADNVEIIYSSSCFDPQEISDGISYMKVFSRIMGELEEIDLVILVADGAQVHDGSAFFAGAAWAKDIPVWLLRTDARKAGERDVEMSWLHPYILGGVEKTFHDENALLRHFGYWLDKVKPQPEPEPSKEDDLDPFNFNVFVFGIGPDSQDVPTDMKQMSPEQLHQALWNIFG